MRIALLTHQWPGVRLGGIGVYTQACARGLAKAGHDVHVFTLTLPGDARRLIPQLKGVTVHEVKTPAQRIAEKTVPPGYTDALAAGGEAVYRLAIADLLCAEVLRVHKDEPFDVAEGPEYECLTLPLALAPAPKPAIITHLHSGSAIARHAGNLLDSDEQRLRETLELWAILSSEGVCGPGRTVIDDTSNAYEQAQCSIAAQVVPLPLEVPDISFSLADPGAPVLYVGRVELLKGAHLLAQAANIFLRAHPDVSLRILGPDTATAPDSEGKSSGSSMAAWMKTCLADVVRDKVTFLGERTREEIFDELRQCAFVVVPSLRESYSYVCCEALAAGRPVVVSDQTGAAEVAGEAGLQFARGDVNALAGQMARLWIDRRLREDLSALGWDRAHLMLSSGAATVARLVFYERVIRDRTVEKGDRPLKTPELSPHLVLAGAYLNWLRGDQAWAATIVQFYGSSPALNVEMPRGLTNTPGKRLLEVLVAHAQNFNPSGSCTFHLYGAGRHTARLLIEKTAWESHGHKLLGIIDDHPRFSREGEGVGGEDFMGLSVIPLAAAERRLAKGDVVILSSDAFEDQLWQKSAPLRAKGIAVYRLYAPNDAR